MPFPRPLERVERSKAHDPLLLLLRRRGGIFVRLRFDLSERLHVVVKMVLPDMLDLMLQRGLLLVLGQQAIEVDVERAVVVR